MVIVLVIAGFVFLGIGSILLKAHKANKDDYTDFDWDDSYQPELEPVKVTSNNQRNVIPIPSKRK